MAANTSFKQQCPSCEEMVLIKDGKLVGKKVDCPKCKFRFVVEEPKDESSDYEEVGEEEEKPAAKKPAAKAAAKPGSKATMKADPKKDANGKGPAAKKDANGKPAPAVKKKPKKDDDDDDDDKPTFKKKSGKGGSKKVMMAAGIAVVAFGLLGVAGYFVFSGDGPKGSGRTKGGIPGGPGSASSKDKGEGEEGTTKTEETRPKAEKPDLADASNHLVAGGEIVVNVRLKEVVQSPLGRVVFDPASGFSPDTLRQKFGFGIDDVDRLLYTQSFKNDEWIFVVVRTGSAMKLDALKASLQLKSGGTPIKGQDYFITPESWRKSPQIGAAAEAPKETRSRPLAFRLHDSFTLIVGDLEPMKEFLEAEGKPPVQDGFPGAAPSPMPPPPPPGAPGAPPPAGGPAAKPYTTIAPRLKAIFDRIEGKPSLLFSMAIDTAAAAPFVTKQFPVVPSGFAVENAGVAVHGDQGMAANLVLESKSAEIAKKLETALRQGMVLASAWFESEHITVDWKQNDPSRPGYVPPPPPGTPPEKKEENPDALSVTLEGPKLNDRIVQVSGNLSPNAHLALTLKYLLPPIQEWKGNMELAQKQPTPQDLSAAAKAMAAQNKGYPRGTFERPLTPARVGRPYLPNERVSWMTELLPHLGYTEVHRSIEFQQSWTDEKNLGAAMSLIPYFIDPSYPASSRYVPHPKKDVGVGATHFVGIAGVGLDAASYLIGDPAGEGKLGVFGYDRTTPLADVGDHTIIMVQVPPPPVGHVGPWMAGGGSTIRGVPEKNSVAPFVSTQYNGKPGTYALMSDGSVRFIAANVSDDVFKALSVIKKDKQVPLETVPKVEKKTELKATDVPRLTP
jgi:hypothetical protein